MCRPFCCKCIAWKHLPLRSVMTVAAKCGGHRHDRAYGCRNGIKGSLRQTAKNRGLPLTTLRYVSRSRFANQLASRWEKNRAVVDNVNTYQWPPHFNSQFVPSGLAAKAWRRQKLKIRCGGPLLIRPHEVLNPPDATVMGIGRQKLQTSKGRINSTTVKAARLVPTFPILDCCDTAGMFSVIFGAFLR